MSPIVNAKSSQEVGQPSRGSVELGVSRKVWAGRGSPAGQPRDKSVCLTPDLDPLGHREDGASGRGAQGDVQGALGGASPGEVSCG